MQNVRSEKAEEKTSKIDTVGRNVLSKVPKGQPKGSQMEPGARPKSSKIDTFAGKTLEVGTGSKNTGNLYKTQIEYCKNNISKSYSECVYPTFACIYSGRVSTGARSKNARTLSNQLLDLVEVRTKPAHNL